MNTQFEATLMIGITEAQNAADEHDKLEDKIDAAMNATVNHWMILDETKQFQAAVGGLILSVEDEKTRERITKEMKSISALSAVMSGVPVDLEQVDIDFEFLGLLKRWKELKKEN